MLERPEERRYDEGEDDETMLLTIAAIVLAFFVGLGAWLMAPEDAATNVLVAAPEQVIAPAVERQNSTSGEVVSESRERRPTASAQIAAVATPPAVATVAAKAVPEVTVDPAPPIAEPEPVVSAPVAFEPVEPVPEAEPEPAPEPEPEPEPVVAAQEPTQEMVSTIDEATDKVTFFTASTRLTDESLAILDKVAVVMQANPSRRLGIIGHTDSQGDADKNVKLSYARAQACADYLVSKGVPSNQMEVAGMGEQMPVTSNQTAAGREQNRRVEFQLLES